jgi:hypothetical protein
MLLAGLEEYERAVESAGKVGGDDRAEEGVEGELIILKIPLFFDFGYDV